MPYKISSLEGNSLWKDVHGQFSRVGVTVPGRPGVGVDFAIGNKMVSVRTESGDKRGGDRT